MAPMTIHHPSVYHSKGKAEQNGNNPGKQNKKGNTGGQSIFSENGKPDIGFISTVNGIYNPGIIGSICSQLNAELFSGIAGRNRTEYITAGRIFAGQPGFTCTVTGAEFIINIDVYILQGRTDGDVRFLESVRKL